MYIKNELMQRGVWLAGGKIQLVVPFRSLFPDLHGSMIVIPIYWCDETVPDLSVTDASSHLASQFDVIFRGTVLVVG